MLEDQLCFKSEYHTEAGRIEAFNAAGEYLCVDPSTIVQPVAFRWEEA